MQKELTSLARRTGGPGILVAAIAAMSGCVTAPPPMVITPAAPPTVVYQAPLPMRVVPTQPTAPVQAQPTPVAPVQPHRAAQQLSDGQVVGVLTEANNAEIHEAQLALRISTNPRVHAFARQMIADHSRLNNRLLSLADEIGIAPTQSPASLNLSRTSRQAFRSLSALRGRSFDVTYIRHQVAVHQTVLNGLNRILLPSARRPVLRSALTQIRPVLGNHLQRARDLLLGL